MTPEATAFLADFSGRNPLASVLDRIRDLSKLRVLVIGDAIIDEYHFVRPYGMPLKSPVIAAQFLESETHAGGVLAVANHLASFCKSVALVTGIGAADSREAFIRERLAPNIIARLITIPNRPTTVKRRYLNRFLTQKLFEVSFFDDAPPPASIESTVAQQLDEVASAYDLVVASDFGHGFITDHLAEILSARATFLAVNTQLNSINHGFHVVTRYQRADYACLDELEARMACRDRSASLVTLAARLRADLGGRTAITVTRGHHGSTTFAPGRAPTDVPILSHDVVDTIGAGDAFFALAAPCAARGFDPDLIGFLGNVAGAISVAMLGNQRAVGRDAFVQRVTEIMSGASP